MKQLFTRNGRIVVETVPAPRPGPGQVVVRTAFSCISPGTERTMVRDSERGSALYALLEQPARAGKALSMLRREGVRAVAAKVRGTLELGEPLGYSLAGEAVEAGAGVTDVPAGTRVACAGAPHAEYVAVPRLLLAPVPANVDARAAATAALGAIAVQGIRRAGVSLGEWAAVIGLGALGQLTGLLLRRAGCRVIGFDVVRARCAQAAALGFDAALDPRDAGAETRVRQLTRDRGADTAIVTAAAPDAEPVALAARVCRRKGRVVAVGDVRLELARDIWYAKELDFLMSTSYGPGRYDARYEEAGLDYPAAYVRWTENRNMEGYLDHLAGGLDVAPLIGGEIPLENAAAAYEAAPGLAPLRLIRYAAAAPPERVLTVTPRKCVSAAGRVRVALIGPGEFATDVHLPNLVRLRDDYVLHAVVARRGDHARAAAQRFGAARAATDVEAVLSDPDTDAVFITTRHDVHASLAIRAARAGKAVFVEKPMAVTREELDRLAAVLRETGVPFMVGFNRRFSPLVERLRAWLDGRAGPAVLHYRVNTAAPPAGHWFHGAEGGGQWIGEGCHFIDLLNCLAGQGAVSFQAAAAGSRLDGVPVGSNVQVTLRYRDGSLAGLLYTTAGHTGLPKERLEVFSDGAAAVLEDFRTLRAYGCSLKPAAYKTPCKGHLEELRAWARHLKGEQDAPISLDALIAGSALTLDIDAALVGKAGSDDEC
ncbi:MAG: bi-domain-containing oxidoreductase [Lentisphaerae bacterium]|nr:bi-domain-containing oxidoreductase [Lentisphaerota bacterium]